MSTAILTQIEMGSAPHLASLFPHAPAEWTLQAARKVAWAENIVLTEEHWEVVRALQSYAAHQESHTVNLRELRDALEEHFHALGGMKYLYRLFPGGPITLGLRMAGLQVPAIATDRGFGSVM